MRYQFISAEKANHRVSLLCKVMKVVRSGYYAWTASGSSRREQENEKLLPLVREIHAESDATFGARRIAKALRARGEICGRDRARTIMRLAGVKVTVTAACG